MIVTADWVVPVSAPPIEHGAVAVREGAIVEVGHAADVCSRWLDDEVVHHDGCILAPGLVNAHTHLALSVAAGLAPPGPLHPWLGEVTKIVLGLSHAEFGHSAAAGALECLKTGTTSVGDIVYGMESMTSATAVGLGGVFFWEVLGLSAEDLRDSLERRGYPWHVPVASAGAVGAARTGLSPHAPYSSGPELLRATYELALDRGQVFAIHVSEAAGEVELIERGTGPFAVQAERLAHGFETPGTSPVRYLSDLGVLDDATCIHAVHVSEDDIALLAEKSRAVVLCPRSNAYLGNGEPRVADLRSAAVTLALGTDSSASNADLDLFNEARALRSMDPTMPAGEVLKMMTLGGAEALGMQGVVGGISPGARADLIAMRPARPVSRTTASAAAPVAAAEGGAALSEALADALLATGSAGVEAVMTGGAWQVVDQRPTFDTGEIEDAAARAREHAERLLRGAS